MNAAHTIRIALAVLLLAAGCVKLASTEAPKKAEIIEPASSGEVCALGTTCR
jgi:nitrous oxide reductase accessory protein NosL